MFTVGAVRMMPPTIKELESKADEYGYMFLI